MGSQSESPIVRKTGLLAMWAGWIVGPVAWAAHQNISYMLTHWTCGSGAKWPIYLATVVALAVVVAGGVLSWRARQVAVAGQRREANEKAASRGRFLATVAILISAISAAGIVVETIPVPFLDLCAGAT